MKKNIIKEADKGSDVVILDEMYQKQKSKKY